MSDGVTDIKVAPGFSVEENAESKLLADMKIIVQHEGETINLTKKNFIEVIKQALIEYVNEETLDDEFPVNVSIYMRDYEYSDNLEAIRTKIAERLNNCDAETLYQMLEAMNK